MYYVIFYAIYYIFLCNNMHKNQRSKRVKKYRQIKKHFFRNGKYFSSKTYQ